MSLATYYLEHGHHVARLRRRRRRRRRAYAPTSNTASHDNHEKINSWVSFAFLSYTCLSMGLRLTALRAAGAPLQISDPNKRDAKGKTGDQKGIYYSDKFKFKQTLTNKAEW